MADPCYLLQLSDCHLAPEAGTLYRGYDADRTLAAVVADAAAQGIAFDRLLLTGDLVQHGAAAAYRRLLALLEPLALERHWIAGNHDETGAMAQVQDGALQRKRIDCGAWRLLLLDSTAEPDGRGGGALSEAELVWLQAELELAQSSAPQRYLLLALHHNPLPTGSGWQDQIRLANGERFCALIRGYPQVRAVICGHLHQFQRWQLDHIQLFCAPSTVFQFKPGQAQLQQEDDPARATPGYSWYRLDADGGVSVEPRWLAATLRG